MLSEFSKTFPAVHIDIDFMDSEQAYELIMQGKAELAIVTLAPTEEASVVTLPVWPDPLDFMVGIQHPLARVPGLDLAALSEHPAIMPGLNTYTGQIVARLFNQHNLTLQVSMATNYLETIRMMASVGLGWTVLPRSMRDDTLATLQVGTPASNAHWELSTTAVAACRGRPGRLSTCSGGGRPGSRRGPGV